MTNDKTNDKIEAAVTAYLAMLAASKQGAVAFSRSTFAYETLVRGLKEDDLIALTARLAVLP